MVNESEKPLPADFGAEEGVFPRKMFRTFYPLKRRWKFSAAVRRSISMRIRNWWS